MCSCVTGVTSHISHIYKGINAMFNHQGPINPYIFWIKIILAIFLAKTRPDKTIFSALTNLTIDFDFELSKIQMLNPQCLLCLVHCKLWCLDTFLNIYDLIWDIRYQLWCLNTFPYVVSKYLWFDIEIFVANFDVWARGSLSTSRRVEHLPSSPSTHRASGKQHKEGLNV